MQSLFRLMFKRFFLKKDPLFKRRPASDTKFGNWLIVEIGADEYCILLDMLNTIRISETDTETKGRQIVGLRYCALAMSLRTKSGRIPLDYNQQNDLLWLGSFPFTEIEKSLNAVAQLSDIPWVNPTIEKQYSDEEHQKSDAVISKEELETNPF